jgi:CelD/BcsL family acetyltransferase involved in cellulose biosynthesis
MLLVLKPKLTCPPRAAPLNVVVEPDFNFLSDDYRSLHRRSRTTAFQAPHWLQALYRDVVPAMQAEAFVITVREAVSGRLMLVLPLARSRRSWLRFIEFADFGLCDYLRAVYDPADAPILLGDATLHKRIAAHLPPCDVISLTKLTAGDLVLEGLFPRARRARMRVSAYPVKIGTDWAAWRSATLDCGFSRDLDIKRRRLAKKGWPSMVVVRDHGEIVQVFDALRNFRAERFRERGVRDVLDDDAVFSFYRRIAAQGAHDGSARTFCLYLSGVPVAVMFGLVHRGTFSLLLVGFDLARYRRLSLGLLAIEDTLRASIETGDTTYDFTIGDYPYKVQFGAESVPLHEWHTERTVRGYLAVVGIDVVREVKRRLKPIVKRRPRSPAFKMPARRR